MSSSFRYLIEQKADVAAVNNDGELAIDISESDEMEELLQKEIDSAGIDCEARNMKLKANRKCGPEFCLSNKSYQISNRLLILIIWIK